MARELWIRAEYPTNDRCGRHNDVWRLRKVLAAQFMAVHNMGTRSRYPMRWNISCSEGHVFCCCNSHLSCLAPAHGI